VSRVAEQIDTVLAEDLPPGWSLATIEDLVGVDGVFVDGDWVESKDQDPTGDVRLIQLADIGDGEYRNKSNRFLTHKRSLELGCTFLMRDDVLIARMPDPLGRACVFPGDRKKSVTVVDVAIIRSGYGEFNHRWLMYFINAPVFRNSVASLQSGSTRKRISRGNLARLALPVPPREQQDRLVAEIEKQFSRLDEAIATLKRVKSNLKRYKASVLKAAVEGKLTEDWRKQHPDVEPASKLLERILATRRAEWNGRGKYKEPTPSDTNELPSLPKGWTWATIEQLAAGFVGAIQSGPFGSQLLHSEFVDDGILAIGIDNVLDGKFSLGRQHRIAPAKFEILKKFEARPSDVVITVMATVGRVCVLPQSLEQAIITKHCYRIAPVPGNVDSEFLAVALRADSSTRQYIFGNVRGQTRPGINGSILKAAPVSLPPFIEQKEIVAEVERSLSVIEELKAAVQANLTRADRLRQSILSQAFSDRLLGQDTRHIQDILPTFSIAAESQARYGKANRAGR
jgi:type I restriction enzyme S subunit